MHRPATHRPTISARLGGLSFAAGGVLFAAGNLLHPLQHDEAAYQAATWEAAHVVILVSLPLLLLGLPALCDTLRARGGRASVGMTAVLFVIGAIGMAPGLLLEAFIAPEVGHHAMEAFEETGYGTVSGIMATAWLASLGSLTVACRQATLGPAAVRWSFAAAAVLLLATMGAGTSEAVGAVIIAATAVYGIATAVLGWQVAQQDGTPDPVAALAG
jgi:hypothetical protein